MEERRKFIRIPESSQISYQILHNMKIGDYLTRDLGQGGLRFFVHEFIPRNTLLKIRLNLEKKFFSFEAAVKVAWIKEVVPAERFEVGVEFINLPYDTSSRLINYIKNNLNIP